MKKNGKDEEPTQFVVYPASAGKFDSGKPSMCLDEAGLSTSQVVGRYKPT